MDRQRGSQMDRQRGSQMGRYKSSLGSGGIPSSVEPTTANIIAQQSQVEIDRQMERQLDGQI